MPRRVQFGEWEAGQGTKRTPILALTAHAMEESAEKSREAGCDAHLTKPIRQATLLDAISECCGSRGTICVRPPADVQELAEWYLEKRRSDLAALSKALQSGEYDAIRIMGTQYERFRRRVRFRRNNKDRRLVGVG